ALGAVKALSGEAVDFRTDEEIFRDNLKAALPAANGEFEAYLFVEEIEDTPGVIYAAKNGSGYVVVLDTTPQSFVGIDATGKIVTDCPAEDKSAIESAMAKIAAITTSDVDLSGFEGISSSVLSVKSTSAGSYIVDVTAKGYTSKYGAAPIHIRVSITEEGKIIDTLTVSQSESAGIGDACAKEEFYSQFDGKTEENYGEIDAITGATVTTNAYKKAILEAFKAVSIIKGGNE
ncbi:MAG: FMN-binding protein, partial [Clostridia bacterium]|nr:FMN-binding protein [Clostridia bacterium]